MCAIVGLTPVEVDCDNQWVVVQDTEIMIPLGGKGLAVYDPNYLPITESYPDVEKQYQNKPYIIVADLVHDNCWSEVETDETVNCVPLLWHEIKHQVCSCNWHEHMFKTFKSFSNIFGGIA